MTVPNGTRCAVVGMSDNRYDIFTMDSEMTNKRISYVLRQQLMDAIKSAAEARPITVDHLIKLHDELNKARNEE